LRWINAAAGIANENSSWLVHCKQNERVFAMLLSIIIDAALLVGILAYLVYALTPSEPL
jgi:hypothetical protein